MVWWSNSVLLFKVSLSICDKLIELNLPCYPNTRSTFRDEALVFSSQLGENQVFTGDSMITSETTLQFEVGTRILNITRMQFSHSFFSTSNQVNVGCGVTDPNLELPVRLEYSNDGGRHWNLVVSDGERSRNPYNRMPNQTPTVYSSKTNNEWRRETILLSHLETSR